MSEKNELDSQEEPNLEWFRASDDVRTTVIEGQNFTPTPVEYSVVDGMAIFEGDIILAKIDPDDSTLNDDDTQEGIAITGTGYRWPNGIVPYEIDPALPNQQRVTNAIRHWEQNTSIRMPLRIAENASQYPDYVRFTDQGGCSSWVGKQGGEQIISLGSGCGFGATVHEIGHAVGLWHEQSREDRDGNIKVNWENIEPTHKHNFSQHITDGDDIGPYDFDSIMHYGTYAFSKNGKPTITALGGQSIGQRTGLSQSDISTVRTLYGYPIQTAASWGADRYDIFGIDEKGNVLQLWWNGQWNWSNLGNGFDNDRFVGPITAASWGNGRYDVFGLGQNGDVLQLWWNGQWNWSNLGNGFDNDRFAGPITAASWGNGRYDVFGLGQNGDVLQLWWNGKWHWSNLGNGFNGDRFTGPITAASWGNGRYDVFGLGQNGDVLQLWWNGQWNWSDLGNGFNGDRFTGPLTAASWGSGRYDVFGQGQNGDVLQLWWDGKWNWSNLGNGFNGDRFTGPLTAASWGDKRYDVFGLGQDRNVLQLWWNDGWNRSDLGNGFN